MGGCDQIVQSSVAVRLFEAIFSNTCSTKKSGARTEYLELFRDEVGIRIVDEFLGFIAGIGTVLERLKGGMICWLGLTHG